MNGFTFFKNYYEAINDPDNELSDEEMGKLYNAIFAYMFEDKVPELKGPIKSIFKIMQVSLDRSKRNGTNKQKNGPDMETESTSNGNEMENEWEQNGEEMETESTEMETESNGMETESIANGNETSPNERPFFEKLEIRNTKRRKKESNNKQLCAPARTGEYVSHADILDKYGITGAYREILEEFLRSSYLNGHIVSNDALEDIIRRLDRHYGEDEEAKILSVRKAINGGYYDVIELRDAPASWR